MFTGFDDDDDDDAYTHRQGNTAPHHSTQHSTEHTSAAASRICAL